GAGNRIGGDYPLGVVKVEPKARHDLGQSDLHGHLAHADQEPAQGDSGSEAPFVRRPGEIEEPSQAQRCLRMHSYLSVGHTQPPCMYGLPRHGTPWAQRTYHHLSGPLRRPLHLRGQHVPSWVLWSLTETREKVITVP